MAFAPTVYPYDTIVRITDVIGETGLQGSGVLIAPDEVLTASHVVYTEGKGVASNIRVTPAFNGSAPFGVGIGTFVHYFPIHEIGGGLTHDESQLDFALIHLSQPFTQLGTMGLQANYAGGVATVTGYPASASGSPGSGLFNVMRQPAL